jgi:hypothetical protein
MPGTAIDPIPKQGKFRRALAAVGAPVRINRC